MKAIKSVEDLESLYQAVSSKSVGKVATQLTPLYKSWIEASRFVIVATVGPEGTDVSPRGDDGPVVTIADSHTLWLPDWKGNNRLDTLRNIVRDPRVSLMFMVPGSNNVVRANGKAIVTDDADTINHFTKDQRQPKTVVVFDIEELYFQCAKALIRSKLWGSDDESSRVPTAGDFIKEFSAGFDGETYDSDYPEYAKTRLW